MYDTVGSFWGSVKSALNPINQVKMVYNVAKNPLNPFAQTRAMVNLFRPGGGAPPVPGAGPPPGYQVMPPYPPAPMVAPGGGWGGAPPMGPPPGYGMSPMGPPPGYGGPPPAFMPPQYPQYDPASYQPQTPQPSYDWGPQYASPPPDFGAGIETGWEAAYANQPAF